VTVDDQSLSSFTLPSLPLPSLFGSRLVPLDLLTQPGHLRRQLLGRLSQRGALAQEPFQLLEVAASKYMLPLFVTAKLGHYQSFHGQAVRKTRLAAQTCRGTPSKSSQT
jgi:hypothetical protein